ncbi:hypothetical protein Franean1_2013 [Parafrankia sp. EAN1pec]|nr:hypothetical protein Franean1_2013 [Frankia sp. EAN1pec]
MRCGGTFYRGMNYSGTNHRDDVGQPMTKIVAMVAAVDGLPTIEETDAMLIELNRLPRDPVVTDLIDELLDFRSLLAAAV